MKTAKSSKPKKAPGAKRRPYQKRTPMVKPGVFEQFGRVYWTREDGRTLHMPWSLDELWAMLTEATAREYAKRRDDLAWANIMPEKRKPS